MDIQKEREGFEKLWTDGNGHFRFFEFDQDDCKYRLNGVTDNLSKEDLLSASITLNTAWLFWLGAKKRAVPEGFVLVPVDQLNQWGHMANYAEQYGCPECFEARGYAHTLTCEINEYFAIEAQEPTND